MVFSAYYIILYIILLLSIFFDNVNKTRKGKNFFVVILVLFSGFRYDAGIDYFNYLNMIEGSYTLSYIEPFSRFFLLWARESNNPFIFFLFTSIIYMYGIFKGAANFKSNGLLFVFLFTTYTTSYLTSFGFVRQFVAIGIVFLGFSYLYRKRKRLFIYSIIIATCFHLSAIVYIIFIFGNKIFKKKYPIYIYICLITLSFFVTKIFILLVSKLGLFVNYFDNNTGLDHVSGKKIFYSMILVFFFVLFYQRMFLNEVKNKTLIYAQNMSFIGLFLYGTFLQFGEHVARISYYFTPFFFIWMSHLYKELKGIHVRISYLIILFLVGTFYFFTTLFYAQFSSRGDILNNYELIFLR